MQEMNHHMCERVNLHKLEHHLLTKTRSCIEEHWQFHKDIWREMNKKSFRFFIFKWFLFFDIVFPKN